MAESQTPVPDWEAFGRAIMQNWPEGDVDGEDLQELALKHGLLMPVPGGFNPEVHKDFYGCAEPGDSWLMKTYLRKA